MKIPFLTAFCLIFSSLAGEVYVPTNLQLPNASSIYRSQTNSRSVDHGVHIDLVCQYPVYLKKNQLSSYVEKAIKNHMHKLEEDFVHEITDRYDHNQFDEYYDGPNRNLEYVLAPTYCSPDLISLFGSCYRYYACPHGCIQQEGKTFWKKGDAIGEATFSDLFVNEQEAKEHIANICENRTQENTYKIEEIQAQHITAFTITEKGLAIIFQPFILGSWTEGPDYVLIPYEELRAWIHPEGPLQPLLQNSGT